MNLGNEEEMLEDGNSPEAVDEGHVGVIEVDRMSSETHQAGVCHDRERPEQAEDRLKQTSAAREMERRRRGGEGAGRWREGGRKWDAGGKEKSTERMEEGEARKEAGAGERKVTCQLPMSAAH